MRRVRLKGNEEELAGLAHTDWFRMHQHTHNRNGRIEWPDGGCYLDQPYIVIEVWSIISEQLEKYRAEQERSRGKKRH